MTMNTKPVEPILGFAVIPGVYLDNTSVEIECDAPERFEAIKAAAKSDFTSFLAGQIQSQGTDGTVDANKELMLYLFEVARLANSACCNLMRGDSRFSLAVTEDAYSYCREVGQILEGLTACAVKISKTAGSVFDPMPHDEISKLDGILVDLRRLVGHSNLPVGLQVGSTYLVTLDAFLQAISALLTVLETRSGHAPNEVHNAD